MFFTKKHYPIKDWDSLAKHINMQAKPDEFYYKVAANGCWEWQFYTERGYGRLTRNYKTLKAHRYFYERKFGPIPTGLSLDHLCRNRKCVNPAHLEPVSVATNNKRRRIFGETILRQKCCEGCLQKLGFLVVKLHKSLNY